jgi:hypothetical protein
LEVFVEEKKGVDSGRNFWSLPKSMQMISATVEGNMCHGQLKNVKLVIEFNAAVFDVHEKKNEQKESLQSNHTHCYPISDNMSP